MNAWNTKSALRLTPNRNRHTATLLYIIHQHNLNSRAAHWPLNARDFSCINPPSIVTPCSARTAPCITPSRCGPVSAQKTPLKHTPSPQNISNSRQTYAPLQRHTNTNPTQPPTPHTPPTHHNQKPNKPPHSHTTPQYYHATCVTTDTPHPRNHKDRLEQPSYNRGDTHRTPEAQRQ